VAFTIQVHPSVKAFFAVAIILEVGNGRNTLFWTVRWLHGQSLAQLVPNLYGSVPNKARKRTIFEAMTELRWVRDIRGGYYSGSFGRIFQAVGYPFRGGIAT